MGFCLGSLIIAVVLDIIAVIIPYWVAAYKINIGLWKMCTDGNCVEVPNTIRGFHTFRGLHVFALTVGVITLILYIFVEVFGVIKKKIGRLLVVILSILTGAFILITNIYMVSRFPLYPVCNSISQISAIFFFYVGGFLTSARNCDSS